MYFAKIESKKALFCLNVCERGNSFTREKLTLLGKIHTLGSFECKKTKFFLLFIFMINNSAVLSAFLISEKMNSK